ncbi:MAG: PTS sugar transporter subunit IIA [Planctomycetota bacterium]|jgi:mannitol/fructose-specific phosphotransferase system IIA component (Ntr-type)
MTSPESLSEIFSVDSVLPDLAGRSKAEVLAEMVACAVSGGVLPKGRKAQALAALQEREERGSTALGRGIAIPHAKIPGLRRHAGLVARSLEGVDFRSIDGEPVHVFVLLVSPETRLDEHLATLRWISRVARDGDFVSFIRQARTPQEILDVLHERAG